MSESLCNIIKEVVSFIERRVPMMKVVKEELDNTMLIEPENNAEVLKRTLESFNMSCSYIDVRDIGIRESGVYIMSNKEYIIYIIFSGFEYKVYKEKHRLLYKTPKLQKLLKQLRSRNYIDGIVVRKR